MFWATLKEDHDDQWQKDDSVKVVGFFWHSGDGLHAVVLNSSISSFTNLPARLLAPYEET